MTPTNFPVGSRINYNGNLATVKFVGAVDDTKGIWLGVEWDDPSRGKHDGSKDGKRYFTCRFNNSGSFIRPNSHVISGVSFLKALTSKYVETLHGSDTQETVTLGSSDGAIQVEAVSLDKIRQRFAQLDRLRVVSLDNENVATCDPTGQISEACPSIFIPLLFKQVILTLNLLEIRPDIRDLDLSQNLISTWEVVAEICRELRALGRLSLNLQRVVLTSNVIKAIPFPAASEPLTSIKQVSLSMNDIGTWPSIDALSCWFPSLESLSFIGNPLSKDVDNMNYSRPFIIARIPSLLQLDGAFIPHRERNDSELFYLSKTVQQEPVKAIRQSHYHWERLCQKHGEPDEVDQKPTTEKLSDKLIELLLYQKADPIAPSPVASIRVLPTMSVRNLRMKIAKTVKAGRASLQCWIQNPGSGTWSELDKNDDGKDLAWFGMEHGTTVAYKITK
ncbi:hypothetical protein CVT24_003394 [Panaeolus cyanescens]|uniref:CAP-Gly domain-containing protein n=1 Tax=Panaeolus cyanescens TaxID=181874 RepID=A0A409Y769_9AGAR|nr:hypothetical protein CVT24_003394 [Panaeolus cyanescens]